MDEYGALLDVGTELADIPDGDMYFNDVVMDEIPGDALSVDAPIDVSVDYSEQESFEQFLISEAEDNGVLDQSFEMHELDNTLNDMTEKPTLTEDDVNWALENYSKEELSKFRDAIENKVILPEMDEIPSGMDSGPVRVRRR